MIFLVNLKQFEIFKEVEERNLSLSLSLSLSLCLPNGIVKLFGFK